MSGGKRMSFVEMKETDPKGWRKKHQDPEVLRFMRNVGFCVNIFSVVSSVGYFLFPCVIFFWLVIGCLVCTLWLEVAYPAYFSVFGVNEKKKENRGSYVDISLTSFAPIIVMVLRMGQLNYDDIGRLLLLAGVGGLILAVAQYILVVELRYVKFGFLEALLFSVVLSFALIANGNWVLDFSEPVETVSVVEQMGSSSRGRGRRYYVTVQHQGESKRFDVSIATYRKLKVGDSVIISTKQGALNLSYHVVTPEE